MSRDVSPDAVPEPPLTALTGGLSLVRGAGPEQLAALRALVGVQDAMIREQAGALARGSGSAAEAVAAAGIGVFECRLADGSLNWTDAVYDLFELPRGLALRRGRVLDHYLPDSLALLERVRGAALASGRGFDHDAEILTARGTRRWIRISAAVGCAGGVPCGCSG